MPADAQELTLDDELTAALERLVRERSDGFVRFVPFPLLELGRLSPAGLRALSTLVPGWRPGSGGRALARRLELAAPAEAAALLVALRARLEVGPRRPAVRFASDGRRAEVALAAPSGPGLPVWVLALVRELSAAWRWGGGEPVRRRHASPGPGGGAVTGGRSRPAGEAASPAAAATWQCSPDGRLRRRLLFPGPGPALRFATRLAAQAAIAAGSPGWSLAVAGEVVVVELGRGAAEEPVPGCSSLLEEAEVLAAFHGAAAEAGGAMWWVERSPQGPDPG